MSTAREIEIALAAQGARLAPALHSYRRAIDKMFIDQLRMMTQLRRRRKSKGYRKHVRRTKQERR